MREYSLYFASAFLSVTTLLSGGLCAFSQTQNLNSEQKKLNDAVESALGSQGDSSKLGSSSTLRGLNQSSGSVTGAPGADAMMNQDLLLVNPNKTGAAPEPLQSFIGQTLKLSVDPNKVKVRQLSGVVITVVNDTSRPLVIDGDSAKVSVGDHIYQSASLQTLQKKVLPSKSLEAQIGRLVIEVPPAAVTVGATPTIEDYQRMKSPIRKRYGSDQRRRTVEATRFGERILWPHQETQGILYFETADDLSKAKVHMPVHTLFDAPDKAMLEG